MPMNGSGAKVPMEVHWKGRGGGRCCWGGWGGRFVVLGVGVCWGFGGVIFFWMVVSWMMDGYVWGGLKVVIYFFKRSLFGNSRASSGGGG